MKTPIKYLLLLTCILPHLSLASNPDEEPATPIFTGVETSWEFEGDEKLVSEGCLKITANGNGAGYYYVDIPPTINYEAVKSVEIRLRCQAKLGRVGLYTENASLYLGNEIESGGKFVTLNVQVKEMPDKKYWSNFVEKAQSQPKFRIAFNGVPKDTVVEIDYLRFLK